MHGISISYPDGWSVQRATQPWSGGLFYFKEPVGDFLYDSALTDHLFLALASQDLPEASADTWAADLFAQEGCGATRPVVIDRADGLISADCNLALVSVDGRGYLILLYISGDDPSVGEVHNRAWFEQILASVELDPAAAAIPSPAASSRLGEHSNPGFRVPFTYVLPDEPAFDYGTRNETFWEIRVPEWFEAGHPAGLILQAIGGGRRDPCDLSSRELQLPASAEAVFEYLRNVDALSVGPSYRATLGDTYPFARQALVSRAEQAGCAEIWPWIETTEPLAAPESPGHVRLVAHDESGELLVFTIFGEAENPIWLTKVQEIFNSIRFRTE